jgi:hypothetical protein
VSTVVVRNRAIRVRMAVLSVGADDIPSPWRGPIG